MTSSHSVTTVFGTQEGEEARGGHVAAEGFVAQARQRLGADRHIAEANEEAADTSKQLFHPPGVGARILMPLTSTYAVRGAVPRRRRPGTRSTFPVKIAVQQQGAAAHRRLPA
jgi:hypothetical protein